MHIADFRGRGDHLTTEREGVRSAAEKTGAAAETQVHAAPTLAVAPALARLARMLFNTVVLRTSMALHSG